MMWNPPPELGLKYPWPSLSCISKLCLWIHLSRTHTHCFASLPLLHHYHPVKFVIRHCVLFQILVFFSSLIISKWFKCSRYFFSQDFLQQCICCKRSEHLHYPRWYWFHSFCGLAVNVVAIIHFSSFSVVCICDGCFCNRQYSDTLEVCWFLELDEGWDALTHFTILVKHSSSNHTRFYEVI